MINLVTREVKRFLTDDLGWPDEVAERAQVIRITTWNGPAYYLVANDQDMQKRTIWLGHNFSEVRDSLANMKERHAKTMADMDRIIAIVKSQQA